MLPFPSVDWMISAKCCWFIISLMDNDVTIPKYQQFIISLNTQSFLQISSVDRLTDGTMLYAKSHQFIISLMAQCPNVNSSYFNWWYKVLCQITSVHYLTEGTMLFAMLCCHYEFKKWLKAIVEYIGLLTDNKYQFFFYSFFKRLCK